MLERSLPQTFHYLLILGIVSLTFKITPRYLKVMCFMQIVVCEKLEFASCVLYPSLYNSKLLTMIYDYIYIYIHYMLCLDTYLVFLWFVHFLRRERPYLLVMDGLSLANYSLVRYVLLALLVCSRVVQGDQWDLELPAWQERNTSQSNIEVWVLPSNTKNMTRIFVVDLPIKHGHVSWLCWNTQRISPLGNFAIHAVTSIRYVYFMLSLHLWYTVVLIVRRHRNDALQRDNSPGDSFIQVKPYPCFRSSMFGFSKGRI